VLNDGQGRDIAWLDIAVAVDTAMADAELDETAMGTTKISVGRGCGCRGVQTPTYIGAWLLTGLVLVLRRASFRRR
jgi:hypothetical protein